MVLKESQNNQEDQDFSARLDLQNQLNSTTKELWKEISLLAKKYEEFKTENETLNSTKEHANQYTSVENYLPGLIDFGTDDWSSRSLKLAQVSQSKS